MNDLITIIVPVYNVKPYLVRCFDSIIKQTYANIEIIIVDDGSTDGSDKVIDEYAKRDNRIRAVHQKNGGLSAARNTGMKYMHGEYLFFLDSDDYIRNNAIELMHKTMVEKDLNILCCNRVLFWDDGKERIQYKSTNGKVLVFNSKDAIVEMNKYTYFDMSAHSKMYKTEIFDQIEFPVGKLSEDMFIMYLLFDKSKSIGYIDIPLLYYYQRSGSISKTKRINYDFIEAAEQQRVYVSNRYPELKKYMEAICMISNLTVYDIVVNNGGKCSKDELEYFKGNIKKYYKRDSIKQLSFKRRIQLRLFIINTALYNLLIKIYKKI